MLKFYCINCKWSTEWEGAMGGHGWLCDNPDNLDHYDTAIQPACRYRQKPEVINEKNDCMNYKRSSWKFWVKEDENA